MFKMETDDDCRFATLINSSKEGANQRRVTIVSFLKSLLPDAVFLNAYKAFPAPPKPLVEYHEVSLGRRHR